MSRTQIAAAEAGAIGGPSTTRDGNTAAAGAAGTHNNNNPFSDAESDAEDGSAAAPEEPPPTYTDAMRNRLHWALQIHAFLFMSRSTPDDIPHAII